MAAWVWIVVVIAVVAVVVLGAMVAKNRRTAMLRDRFGPEYDRAVENTDDRRAAETELLARQKQRAEFDVKPLPEADRLRFAAEWRDLQERFLDEPAESADAADALVTRVMEARGYPMLDFDTQADLVSVDYPQTVENYRFAHAVQQRSQAQQASTEELREALLRYRSLFDELLHQEGDDAAGTTADYMDPASSNGRQRGPAGPDAQVAEASLNGHVNGPADPGTDYRDQQIGR